MGRYTLCPYYMYERNQMITCEDVYRRFETKREKYAWMDRYCDDKWAECPYAISLTQAYERLEKGDDAALDKHKLYAMSRELQSMATKLGSAQAKNRSLYEKLKQAQEQLEQYEKTIDGQIKQIVLVYEQRLAYMIEAFAPGHKLYEDEIKEWAGDKAYAIVLDRDDYGDFWKVVFESADTDKQTEAET